MSISKLYKNCLASTVLLVNLIGFTQAYATDSTTSRSIWDTFVNDLERSTHKSVSFLTSPARGSLANYLYASGFAASMAGLIAVDDKISPAIRDARTLDREPIESVLSFSKNLGERNIVIGSVAAGYLTGLFANDEKIRNTSRLCAEGLLFSGGITLTLKVVTGRYRPVPDNSIGKWDWNIWELLDNEQSFPSGHATAAFALSSVLADQIDSWVFDAGIYSVATLTALSRVDDGRHWFADAVAGAVIGTMCGLYVCREEDRMNDKGTSWMLVPSSNGLGVRYTF